MAAITEFVKQYYIPIILFSLGIVFQLVLLPQSYPPSYYDVLGIKQFAPVEDVTAAYERLSSRCLPQYPPSKEMDAKLRDEEARRLRAAGGRANGDGTKKSRTRDRAPRAVPAPEANAELQANLDRRRLITHANAKSKSEKFPPPHQDGALGFPLGSSHHMDPAFEPHEASFSTVFPYQKGQAVSTWSGPLVDPAAVGHPKRKKQQSGGHNRLTIDKPSSRVR